MATALQQLGRYWSPNRTTKRSPNVGDPVPDIDLFAGPAVQRALLAAFHNKCAFCESFTTEASPITIAHFRPTSSAVGLDGVASRQHYWWLTYEWTNLLPICSDCNRSKGSRFPIRGTRADQGESFDREGRLLLDPCTDDPASHLVFFSDGTVASDTDQGKTTIDALALNRPHLVEARASRARSVLALLEATNDIDGTWKFLPDRLASGRDRLANSTAASAEFSTLCRQVIEEYRDGGRGERFTSRQLVKASFATDQTVKQAYELTGDKESMADVDRSRYFGTTRWIERIVLHNFRAIADLELDCSSSPSTGAPWTVLLGENGTGKSSILQAIALALIGDGYRRRLEVRPERVLRHGTKRGAVTVWTSNLAPFDLAYRLGEDTLEGTSEAPMLLLAYGSTRLLPRTLAETSSESPGVARVDNLFDPFLPLPDPAQWLLELPPVKLADVEQKLKVLLALDEKTRLVTDHERAEVTFRTGRTRSTLAELSDGYQSMLVLVCDVMRTVLTTWDTVEQAEGIVLIDELGAHLHPTWRMRVRRSAPHRIATSAVHRQHARSAVPPRTRRRRGDSPAAQRTTAHRRAQRSAVSEGSSGRSTSDLRALRTRQHRRPRTRRSLQALLPPPGAPAPDESTDR